jgi:predicted RNase H-like HicB family nuclease
MRTYTVVLTEELAEGGYSVAVPALPGQHSQGETLDEALANAREAIACYLEGLAKDGEPFPDDIVTAGVPVRVAEPVA